VLSVGEMAIIDGQLVVFGIDRFVPNTDLHNTTPPSSNPTSPQEHGITMILSDMSLIGFSFQIKNPTGIEYIYSTHYALYERRNGAWERVEPIIDDWNWLLTDEAYFMPPNVEPIIDDWNWLFTDEAYFMPPNATTGLTSIDWFWNFGELPNGDYKFEKEIMLWRSPGDFDTYALEHRFKLPLP
jgi:hypothetical protein